MAAMPCNLLKISVVKYSQEYAICHSHVTMLMQPNWIRRTRMPAFWDTPAAPWLPTLVIHIRSQVKTRQSQTYKFKNIGKNSNFEILQETLHTTHLLKLLDKMYKYEMDPARTVGATERTQDAGRTGGQTYGQTDGRSETNIPRNNFVVRWA